MPSSWRRTAVAAPALAATTVAVVTPLLYVGGIPPSPTLAVDTAVLVATAMSGLLLVVACWATLGPQPVVSVGLAVACLGVLVPSWAWYPGLSAPARAAALAATPLVVAGGALAAGAWRSPAGVSGALRVAAVTGLAASVVQVLAYDPERHLACSATCLPAPAPLADALGARTAFGVIVLGVVVAVASAVVGCAAAPAAPTWLRAGAASSALLVGACYLAVWQGWGDLPRPAWWDEVLAGAAVALSVSAAASVVRAAVTRDRLRRLAHRIDDPVPALAAAVGVRAIQLRVPESDVWVDPAGRPVAPAEGGLVLSDSRGASVRLLLPVRRDPAVAAASLNPSVLLALANLRLDATCRYRRTQLVESQRRIVSTRDGERHRIERDLHDGAQQPLVAATIQLQLASAHADPVTTARLEEAASEVRRSLGALRELSHGLYPAVLSGGGLQSALDELAAESPLTVATDLTTPSGLDPSIQLAAYDAVDVALDAISGRPSAHRATVRAHVVGEWLRIEVVDEEDSSLLSADLVAVRDRVGACGGSIAVDASGSRLEVLLPCA